MTPTLIRYFFCALITAAPLQAGLAASPGAAVSGPATDDIAVSVQLDVQPKGEPAKRPVTPGETLYEGDRISLRVAVDHDAFIYVVQVFPSGDSQTLYPRPSSLDVEQPVPAGIQTSIPRNSSYVQLDEETGEERILVVASARPIERINKELIQKWDRHQQGAAVALRGEPTNQPAPPPRASRPPPQPIEPNERGEVVAMADGAVVLRARAMGKELAIARFQFQHQGSPLKRKPVSK